MTIPVSLITSFAIMFAMGFTINTLTLLAMVLAIGLVVDDAIVVLENIYRHVEEGMKPIPAAMKGAKEIGFAVVAMTITLAAVYAPIAFAEGRTGRLFLEFALTLAGAVLVSGFVALTLTPMMCSKLLKHQAKPRPHLHMLERVFDGVERGLSRRCCAVPCVPGRLIILIGVVVAGSSVYFFTSLSSGTRAGRGSRRRCACSAARRRARRSTLPRVMPARSKAFSPIPRTCAPSWSIPARRR